MFTLCTLHMDVAEDAICSQDGGALNLKLAKRWNVTAILHDFYVEQYFIYTLKYFHEKDDLIVEDRVLSLK